MFIQKLERPGTLVLIFSTSSIGATFVNKYVLSVLKFTYPTVYQSWQMGFAFTVLMVLSSFGFIQISPLDRVLFRKWLPAMCIFTVGIYSGSKALSLLPVPVFCVIYNLVYVFITMFDEALFKQAYSSMALTGLVISTFGMVLTVKNYTEVDYHSYKWILIHVTCIAFYSLYSKRNSKLPLKELDKIMFNSSFSFVALMFLGTLTGEVKRSIAFQFLYHNKFHMGCFVSGLTGSLVFISYSRLIDIMPVSKIRWISSISMAMMSLFSLLLFDFTLSINLALSLVIGLTGSVLYTYSVSLSESPKDVGNDEKRTAAV